VVVTLLLLRPDSGEAPELEADEVLELDEREPDELLDAILAADLVVLW
jgi:hypothetical protein